MGLHVEQTSSPVSEDRWEWAVWLDGPPEELDRVESVTYQLHETFPKPVHTISDRDSGFRLDASGWGEFMIYVTVAFEDGTTESLRHWLQLCDETPDRGGSGDSEPDLPTSTVYLSAGLADSDVVDELRAAFQELGVRVITHEDRAMYVEKTETALQFSLEPVLNEADFGVAVISDSVSSWVQSEVGELALQRTPVIPLVRDPTVPLPKGLEATSAIKLDRGVSLRDVARRIVEGRGGITG